MKRSASQDWTLQEADGKDLKAVRRLIRQEYEKQGFLEDEQSFEKLSAYLDLTTTTTFLARRKTSVLGTVSVIANADQGVPMAALFEKEVEELSGQGRVAEVGQLAVDRDQVSRKEGMNLMFSLFGRVLKYAQERELSHLCIVVNPRHEVFYGRLGFVTMGRHDLYGAVSAPAVAKYLDLSTAKDNRFIQSVTQSMV